MTAPGINEGTPGNRLGVTHMAYCTLFQQVSCQDDSQQRQRAQLSEAGEIQETR